MLTTASGPSSRREKSDADTRTDDGSLNVRAVRLGYRAGGGEVAIVLHGKEGEVGLSPLAKIEAIAPSISPDKAYQSQHW